MPLKYSELAGDSKTHTFFVGDEPVTVVFNPNRYTPAFEAKLIEISKDDFQARAYSEMLSQIVDSWTGIVEDDGVTPVPCTKERFEGMPVPFLIQMLNEIQGASKPASEEGKSLDGISPQTDSMGGSLIGT